MIFIYATSIRLQSDEQKHLFHEKTFLETTSKLCTQGEIVSINCKFQVWEKFSFHLKFPRKCETERKLLFN